MLQSLPEKNQHQLIQDLYTDHSAWLQQWLRTRISYPFTAADIVQDTFYKLLQSNNLFSIQEPRAYLVQMAKHLLIDQQRRLSLEKNYLAELALQQEDQANLFDDNQLEEVLQILDFLTVALESSHHLARKAFLMYYFEGYNQSEIAEVIGKSLRTTQLYLAECLNLCFAARQQLLD